MQILVFAFRISGRRFRVLQVRVVNFLQPARCLGVSSLGHLVPYWQKIFAFMQGLRDA